MAGNLIPFGQKDENLVCILVETETICFYFLVCILFGRFAFIFLFVYFVWTFCFHSLVCVFSLYILLSFSRLRVCIYVLLLFFCWSFIFYLRNDQLASQSTGSVETIAA